MNSLHESVRVTRRFLRSIRIDADIFDSHALDGFVCAPSFTEVFINMAHHATETGQSAFTWTGPYGSGKSCLALGLAALLSADPNGKMDSDKVFGPKLVAVMNQAFPSKEKGWRILPIVGWRGDPIQTVGEGLRKHGLVAKTPRGGWSEKNLIDRISSIPTSTRDEFGGLLILIDEMGKFLEAATLSNTDIYFFQQLAETASRSGGRILVVGILHQAFQEYANKLSSELRDEWAKIQGRFVDLAINVSGDEQIALISQAIQSSVPPRGLGETCDLVAKSVYRDNTDFAKKLALKLEKCWPLHPVVAYLLGGISRRRFSQNQRSVFGFLNSAEPFGFRDFLKRNSDADIYTPVQLWDYLRANLEPSILASPDGHRWSLAAEALERCEHTGGFELHIQVLKTVAVIDLFKERSGLLPTLPILKVCFPREKESTISSAVERLRHCSLVIFKKHVQAYAVFAGSDFDIDEAIRLEISNLRQIDCAKLASLAGILPIVAKRHYHTTGALRWFEVNLVSLSEVVNQVKKFSGNNSVIGQFVLVLSENGESEDTVAKSCVTIVEDDKTSDTVLGYSTHNWSIVSYARELEAVENVKNRYSILAGDSVARREVNARLHLLTGLLENSVHSALDSAIWFQRGEQTKRYKFSDLTAFASKLADSKFHKSPLLLNELLNRERPSGSAIGARNSLLRRMVLNIGEQRLGIEGYPAEGGLFMSLLQATDLYVRNEEEWKFERPVETNEHNLEPAWAEALKYVKERSSEPIDMSDIYKMWAAAPFGIKRGLLPVLAVAFIQTERANLAIYREGIFRPQFDDVDVDYLIKDPSCIQIRWLDMSSQQQQLLSWIAEILQQLKNEKSALSLLEPLEIARGLVQIYDSLPDYTKRTMRLSPKTVRLRELFRRSQDPHQFLFSDLPKLLVSANGGITVNTISSFKSSLHSVMEELLNKYPTMLTQLRDTMLGELQVPNNSHHSLKELQSRANNIRQLTGDFRIEAYAGRIASYDGSVGAFEPIASLVANKPPRDWVDLDFDRALVDIAEMSRLFLRAETFARVKHRDEKLQAVAVMFGTRQSLTPITAEFYVRDTDQESIDDLVSQIEALLNKLDESRREVVLAALAELSTKVIKEGTNITSEVANDSL